MKVLFYRSGKRADKKGLAPIILRITINKQRAQFTTPFKCKENETEVIVRTNKYFKELETITRNVYEGFISNHTQPTAVDVVNALREALTPKKTISFINAIESYFEARAHGKGWRTVQTYNSKIKRLSEWLEQAELQNLLVTSYSQKHWQAFYNFMRMHHQSSDEHLRRFCLHVRNALEMCVVNGDLDKNPLAGVKISKSKPKAIEYLNKFQLRELEQYEPHLKSLERVKDRFLFQCYTGLSYADLMVFKPSKHVIEDEIYYIDMNRLKNDSAFQVPVLREAMLLIDKYPNGFPRISNSGYNAKLKELANYAKIDVHLTTHIGRKTFGMYMLENGISMEAVSKMLGHSSIKITETYYAQVQFSRVMNEFKHNPKFGKLLVKKQLEIAC